MSNILTKCDEEDCKITLSNYTVPRIVYQILKLYMMNNKPEDVGVILKQKYDPDQTKSDILLDIGFNWKSQVMSKVPAVFVQREDAIYKTPTMGENVATDQVTGKDTRVAIVSLPVIVTCVAAEPVAVVEQLAEYIKQPLLYFRREIQVDYGIRSFILEKVTAPKLLAEGKNNFYVNLLVNVDYHDGWTISRNSLKLKKVDVTLFDQLNTFLQEVRV